MREAIDPSLSPIQTSKIDIYSLKDSLAVFFQYPPHYLIWPFETVLQVVVWALRYASLLITDLQDGTWIREDKMSASLRNTDEPITWCFVLSSFWQCFCSDWCHCLHLSDVFFVLLPPLSLSIQVRLLWFHNTIKVSVSLSFLSNLQWLDGNGVPWSAWQILTLIRVCLLRLRLSKSIESILLSRGYSPLKFHVISHSQHSSFVLVWPCVNDRVCVRTSTIPTWTEALTFPVKQVMHATGAVAMTQELVMACFIQALDIAPKHRRKQHTVPREKDLALDLDRLSWGSELWMEN